MVLDKDLRFVAVNAAYCAVTERSREELLGRKLFDLFPNAGPQGERLRRSLLRVLETGESDNLALIPYPIPRPESRGGGMELRYWSAAHVPLPDVHGRPGYVLQNTVDVTELQQLKTIAYGHGAEPREGEKDLFLRAAAVEEANRALSEETLGLRDLFLQAPGFMAVMAGADLTFTLANAAYQQLIGHRAVVGKPLAEALPEVAGQGFLSLLKEVMRTGSPYVGEAVSVKLQRRPGAALEERFVDFVYQPIASPAGEPWGVFVQGADVTDRVQAEEQRKLLLDELNHRVKNTLATVQAIAAQTLRSTPDAESFRTAFEARIMALSATHNLLTATSWRSASLHDLVETELHPYGSGRYRLDGPEVMLSPAEAVALGLVFHELATNAVKYGALSAPGGEVALRWAISAETGTKRLEFRWTERGGAPVQPPRRRGFGSRLIETSLAGRGGSARLDYAQEGLSCVLELPLGEGSDD
jgi:two-component sensor histidine kinase